MRFFLPDLTHYTCFYFSLQSRKEKQDTNKGTPSLMYFHLVPSAPKFFDFTIYQHYLLL